MVGDTINAHHERQRLKPYKLQPGGSNRFFAFFLLFEPISRSYSYIEGSQSLWVILPNHKADRGASLSSGFLSLLLPVDIPSQRTCPHTFAVDDLSTYSQNSKISSA
jgi:hypothetical protein